MKLLVVFLALTIFTGSQAFVLRNESNFKLTELQRELREYSENSIDALLKKAALAEQTGIGKTLIDLPFQTKKQVNQRLIAIEAALPAEAIEVKRQVSSAFRDLERKVANGLRAIHNKVAPERKAFGEALKSELDSVLRKLDHNIQPFRHKFVNACRELNAKLDEMLKQQVEKMKVPSEKFQIWVEKVQNFLNPVINQMQEQIVREVKKAHDVLQRFAARVLEVVNKHKENQH